MWKYNGYPCLSSPHPLLNADFFFLLCVSVLNWFSPTGPTAKVQHICYSWDDVFFGCCGWFLLAPVPFKWVMQKKIIIHFFFFSFFVCLYYFAVLSMQRAELVTQKLLIINTERSTKRTTDFRNKINHNWNDIICNRWIMISCVLRSHRTHY